MGKLTVHLLPHQQIGKTFYWLGRRSLAGLCKIRGTMPGTTVEFYMWGEYRYKVNELLYRPYNTLNVYTAVRAPAGIGTPTVHVLSTRIPAPVPYPTLTLPYPTLP